MSLRSKAFVILSGFFVLLAAADYVIQRFVVLERFIALERKDAVTDIERCTEDLRNEIHHLSRVCHDWAAWDDTCRFVNTGDPEYAKAHLGFESFLNRDVNLIYVIDTTGHVKWRQIYDLKTGQPIHLTDYSKDHFPPGSSLIRHKTLDSSIDGITMTERGPLLVSSRPIVNSRYEGPVHGTLLIGRFLSTELIAAMSARTHVDFSVWPIVESSASSDAQLISSPYHPGVTYYIRPLNDNALEVSRTFADFENKEALWIRARIPRENFAQGVMTHRYAFISTLTAGIVLLAVVLTLLERLVLARMAHFGRAVAEVATTNDLSTRLPVVGNDEVTRLATGVNQMLAGLEASEKNLIQSEEQYRTLFQAANDAICLIEEGHFVDCNPKTLELFRCRREEIIGENIALYFPPHQADGYISHRRMLELTAQALAGEKQSFEWQFRRKDGSILDAEIGLNRIDLSGRKYALAIIHDCTERKRAEQQLRFAAHFDPLTELPNRTYLMERLEQCVARARRKREYKFAVIFIDLDRFKNINDSLGHLIGDELLKQVAKRFKLMVRAEDTVARLGGDEFVILVDDVQHLSVVMTVADRIIEALASPFHLDRYEVFTSPSMGIALNTSGHESAEALLRDADTAMYRAKEMGRGRYVLFDQKMHEKVFASLRLETDLRNAIRNSELVLHYQPVILLEGNRIAGFEALVRWRHPERGLVTPDVFIPIAEDTSLIVPIGAWIFHEACRQMAEWKSKFPEAEDLHISINVSPRQLVHSDFLTILTKVLNQTNLDPGCVNIEITESVFIEGPAKIQEIFKNIKALGVKLHLDDFGTGYSSLSYLHRFPIDSLKIDRSFTARIIEDEGSREIVRSIFAMADVLQIKVIAEGVEAEMQCESLRAMNCRYVQGYLFARPLDGLSAERAIADRDSVEIAMSEV